MSAAIYLDIVVATLLVATIAYAVILNRKLGRLRADRSGFEKMLEQFVAATERAERGVATLQRVADASVSELDAKRGASSSLASDLEFLVARAEEQADKLERLIADGRTRERPRGEAPQARPDSSRKPAAARPDPAADYLFEAPGDDRESTPDGIDAPFAAEPRDNTPTWLASARKLAGAEEALR